MCKTVGRRSRTSQWGERQQWATPCPHWVLIYSIEFMKPPLPHHLFGYPPSVLLPPISADVICTPPLSVYLNRRPNERTNRRRSRCAFNFYQKRDFEHCYSGVHTLTERATERPNSTRERMKKVGEKRASEGERGQLLQHWGLSGRRH